MNRIEAYTVKKTDQAASKPSRLRWKLTLSYTLVTVLALLVVEIAFLTILFVFINPLSASRIPRPVLQLITQALATTIREDVQTSNMEQINNRLRPLILNSGLTVLVFDSTRALLTAVPDLPGTSFDTTQFSGLDDLLNASLAGQEDSPRLYVDLAPDRILHTVPVVTGDGHVLGAVAVIVTPSILVPRLMLIIFVLIGLSLIGFTGIAGVIGTLFGALTAHDLSRRLEILARTADSWSKGDFSAAVRDRSGDELGQLARRLDLMAEQLQTLIQSNQELAALEERNRLARDLHDSVKQQIFATLMQLAAARALLDRDAQAANTHLADAEALAHQAQQELTALIHELRPAALMGKGLIAALRDYVGDWSRHNGIGSTVRVSGDLVLTLAAEQVFFRIAQEALANVARHSHATAVEIQVTAVENQVTLTVIDDGQGFDLLAAQGRGVGLVSMQERIAALGGSLDIRSVPGKGTHLSASISIIKNG